MLVPPPGRTPATVLRAAGGAGGTGHAGDAGHVADTVLAQAVDEGCGGFMMGTLEVALPMGALREVVPLTPLHCVPSMAHGLIGAIDLRGVMLPVLDLLELLGLGRLPEGGMRELLLLHCGPGLVGLLMERVIDVVGVARDAVVPVPAFALPRPALFSGALPLDALPAALRDELRGAGGAAQCLVLDDTGLRQDEPLCALASTQTPVGQAQAAAVVGALGLTTGGDGALAARRAMVTFELAGEAAVPIEQLAEILPYRTADAAASPAGTGGGALVGLVVDRGRSIPVLDLPRLAAVGQLAPGIDASVLVVQAGEAWLGFAVPRLRAIEPADWEPSLPSHGLGEADALTHTLRSRTLAQVGQGAEQRMLRVLDLGAIAQALQSQRLAA